MGAVKVIGIIVACVSAFATALGFLAESYLLLAALHPSAPYFRVFGGVGVVAGFVMFAVGHYYAHAERRTSGKDAGVCASATLVMIVAVMGAWKAFDHTDERRRDPEKVRLTKIQVDKIVKEYYPRWSSQNTDKACPDSLLEIGRSIDKTFTEDEFKDAWGKPLKFLCGDTLPAGASGLGVYSMGEDGTDNTPDDIRSWEKVKK